MRYKIYKIFLLLIITTLLFGCQMPPEETRSIKGLTIQSEVTTKIEGTFIIGSGYINGKQETKRYFYFFVMGKEGYVLQKVPTERMEIVETNDVNPSIKGIFSYSGRINEAWEYIVYVPIGTIFVEYNTNISNTEAEE